MHKIFLANTDTHKHLNKKMTFVSLGFALFVVFVLIYKAVYSIPRLADESFYTTIPHRVLRGDSLLIDEWFPSQFSSFIQYPFVWLYIKIAGSTNGIVLFMRFVFIAFQMLTGFIIYFKLRHKSYFIGIAAMLMFCLYIPATMLQFSYYTGGIIFAQWIALLLFTTDKREFFRCFVVGVLTALVVTEQPFSAIAYFLYTLLVFVCFVYNKKKKTNKKCDYLSPKMWLYMTSGIFAVFCIFILYLLKDANISDVIMSIPNLFTEPQHKVDLFSFETDLFNYKDLLITLIDFNKVIFPIFIIVLFVFVLDGKRKEHINLWLPVCAVAFVIYYIALASKINQHPEALLFRVFPFFIFSIEIYVLTKNRNKKLFVWWLIGVIYTLCLGTQFFSQVGTTGLIISNTAGMIMLTEFLFEMMKNENKTQTVESEDLSAIQKNKIKNNLKNYSDKIKIIFATIILVVSFETVVGSYVNLFDNKVMQNFQYFDDNQTYVKVENGPYAGLYLPETKNKQYNGILSDLDYIKKTQSGKILVAQRIPWAYLYINRSYPTFSSWDIAYDWQTYKKYFESTWNYPDCIYIPYNDFNYSGEFENCEEAKEYFSKLFDCSIEKGEYGYILSVQ